MGGPGKTEIWVVPGAPLENGAGWRIWYSQPGTDRFWPKEVVVARGGQREPISPKWPLANSPEWDLQSGLKGLDRRMGVLTVTLDHPQPGALYQVSVPEAGSGAFAWRSLPNQLRNPALPDPVVREGVTFLFASCFWRNNDIEGAYSMAVSELVKRWRPAFKLLIGDQVYQDWPWSLTLAQTPVQKYADRYHQYWSDPGYQHLLRSTPNFFLGDDHEYWNNYPEMQMQLPQTWTKTSRAKFGQAACETYRLFQQCLNPGPQPWYRFAVGPVSFFVADTRSQRDPIPPPDERPPRFLADDQWADLEAWADGLTGPGVLILGQPMFHHPGSKKDRTLPDFATDYARLVALFDRTLRGENQQHTPHDILMLSGDIHIGRYVIGRAARIGPYNEVHELIASAVSRIAPDIRRPVPHAPPSKLTTPGGLRWDVQMTKTTAMPTLDNNIGLVRMSPGTAAPNGGDRVRFEMQLWRVRPFDSRMILGRLLGRRAPQGPVIPIFKTEIELR
jgi:hypothetical protein